jgi:hypothetical protein
MRKIHPKRFADSADKKRLNNWERIRKKLDEYV